MKVSVLYVMPHAPAASCDFWRKKIPGPLCGDICLVCVIQVASNQAWVSRAGMRSAFWSGVGFIYDVLHWGVVHLREYRFAQFSNLVHVAVVVL